MFRSMILKRRWPRLGLALMAFSLLAVPVLAGPEKTSSVGLTEELSSPSVKPDPAFDRYVDLKLIHPAWEAQDANLLTDVALQLAEGERVLQRTHNSGVTAEQLLGLATKLAAETKSKAALSRLAKAADARGDQTLASRVAAATKLAGENRAPDPALNVSVAKISPEAVARFQGLNKSIQSARLLEDREALDSLDKEMPKEDELPEAQRSYLTRTLKEAREAMPKKTDPSTDALRKLAAPSRGFSIGDVLDNTPFDPNTWTDTYNDISNAGQTIQGEGKYHVLIHNNSGKTIYVCAHYRGSEGWWTTEGWWMLKPGEKKHVFDTKNSYVYFYAEDGKGTCWRGNNQQFVVNSKFKFVKYQGTWKIPSNPRYVKFIESNMGSKFVDFTFNFNR